MKIILAVLALTLTPAIAMAACSYGEKQAVSCKAGTAFDHETGTCVATNA